MNVNTKIKQEIETNTENTTAVIQENDKVILENVNMPFSNIMNELQTGTLNDTESNLSLLNIDFNYDSLSMDYIDAMFFVNLTKEGQFAVNNNNAGEFQNLIQTETIQNVVSQKTVEVTNKLTELIQKAQTTQKPVRISFDNDVSVVLKIDKHGKLTAEFIPGSIEVENYLRNNIASLRQKFDEQNLPYNDLLYRQNSKQNKNKKDKGDN